MRHDVDAHCIANVFCKVVSKPLGSLHGVLDAAHIEKERNDAPCGIARPIHFYKGTPDAITFIGIKVALACVKTFVSFSCCLGVVVVTVNQQDQMLCLFEYPLVRYSGLGADIATSLMTSFPVRKCEALHF